MRLNSSSILVLLFRRVTASPIYATLDNLVSTDGNTDGSTGGATGGSTDGSFGMFNMDVSFNTANPSPVDEPVRSGFRPDIINSNEVPNPILTNTDSGLNTGFSSSLARSGTTDVTQGYPVGQSDTIYLAENSASQDMCYDKNHGKALKMREAACLSGTKYLKCPVVAAGKKFQIQCVDEFDIIFILVGIALAVWEYIINESRRP